MKYRVFSDLHLDFDYANRKPLWTPNRLDEDSETTLIVAGDIWTGRRIVNTADWLNEMSKRFKHVVAVLGNHDYWGFHDWRVASESLEMLVNENVYILEKEWVDIEGVRIGGATLWSSMDEGNPVSVILGKDYTNDIRYIKGMTTDSWMQEYRDTMDWISSNDFDILVTHFVPSRKFTHPKYKHLAENCMFSSNAAELLEVIYRVPKIWLFGHTHDSYCEEYLGTKFICNPRGYGFENTHFDERSLYDA
jgi:Icc-related predicted phosphoesterase